MTMMKTTRRFFLKAGLGVVGGAFAGCASHPGRLGEGAGVRIWVSGTPGAHFTGILHWNQRQLNTISVLTAKPMEILQVQDRRMRSAQYEITKHLQSDELVVDACHGSTEKVRLVAGPADRGVRVTFDAAGLRAATY